MMPSRTPANVIAHESKREREEKRDVLALRRGLSSRFAAVNDIVTPSIHVLQRGRSGIIADRRDSRLVVNHKIKRFVQRTTRGLNQALRQVILRKVYMMLAQVSRMDFF